MPPPFTPSRLFPPKPPHLTRLYPPQRQRRPLGSKPPSPPSSPSSPSPHQHLQTIPTCPSPTCSCSPMPSFPSTHPIDHASPLNGIVPTYTSHLLICTGASDWTSRIEHENHGNNPSARLKHLYGPSGTLSETRSSISILNASFAAQGQLADGASVYMLPEFRYIPFLPFLPFCSPPRLPLPPSKPAMPESFPVKDIMVLICGHASRDLRCGVVGPLLQREFEEKLAAAGVEIPTSNPSQEAAPKDAQPGARVGLISHIGGHKFAGNVIIYIPPAMMTTTTTTTTMMMGQTKHPLAGMGIWYGRVEPRHVEGIVAETVLRGRIIRDLLRGGIDAERRMLRL